MNVVGGIARGIPLEVPKGLEIRPTSVRARKSIFDSLRDFSGKTVIDLFAGIGSLGIESASRGASVVYFIDNSLSSCRIIENNLEKIKKSGVLSNFSVLERDAFNPDAFLSGVKEKPNIIFADPPYNKAGEVVDKVLCNEKLASFASGALFIFEAPGESSRKPKMENVKFWEIKSCKNFGQSLFYVMRSKL